MLEQNVHLLENGVEIALFVAIEEEVEEIMAEEVKAIIIIVILMQTNQNVSCVTDLVMHEVENCF